MTQYARPDSDVAAGSWITTPPPAALYTVINEVAAVDADYIQSGLNPAADLAEVGLSNIGDPETDQAHVVRYRYQKSGTAGVIVDLDVYLVQGTTVIASWAHPDIDLVWLQADQVLTGPEADAITDYDDLHLRFVADSSGAGAGRRAQVSWAAFEAPDVPLAGTVAGQSSLNGTLRVHYGVSGTCAAQGTLSGSLSVQKSLAGIVAGTSSLAADLSMAYALKGSIQGQSALAAVLSATVPLKGVIAAVSELKGFLQAITDVGGRIKAQSSLSGTLSSTVPLAGTIAATSSLSGILSRARPLRGVVVGTSSLSAKLTMLRHLLGQIAGASDLAGLLSVHYKLEGVLPAESLMFGKLTLLGEPAVKQWGGGIVIPVGGGVGGKLGSME